jgi:hypothetical protein
MRSLALLGSLVAIGACASTVQGRPADSSFSPPSRAVETGDSTPLGASARPTESESTGTSDDVAMVTGPESYPAPTAPAASRDPVTQTRAGRFRTELLQDKEFRLVFGDVQRLKLALDFHEARWGLLKLLVGPGFDTVSSAGFNLEHLYRAYKAASYYSNDVVVELWKAGAKIGEVTDAGVMIGPEFKVPRDPF